MIKRLLGILLLAAPCFGASYGKVSVTTGATQVFALSKNRAAWIITNTGTGTIWIGFNTSISSTTATPLLPNEKLLNDGPTEYTGAVFAITDSGTQDVRFLEWGNNDL